MLANKIIFFKACKWFIWQSTRTWFALKTYVFPVFSFIGVFFQVSFNLKWLFICKTMKFLGGRLGGLLMTPLTQIFFFQNDRVFSVVRHWLVSAMYRLKFYFIFINLMVPSRFSKTKSPYDISPHRTVHVWYVPFGSLFVRPRSAVF